MLLNFPKIKRKLNSDLKKLNEQVKIFFSTENIKSWCDPKTNIVNRSLWTKMGSLGFLGLSVSKHYGGHGFGLISSLILKEGLSQLNDNGLSLGIHVHNNVGCIWLESSFNENMKKKYLPEAVKGNILFCTCYTESDKNIPSTGCGDGDQIIINAKKSFIVNGVSGGTKPRLFGA